MSKQASFSNTVYNNEQISDRKELKEINNKLAAYFNSTKDQIKPANMYEKSGESGGSGSHPNSGRNENNNPIYSSVRNLEKDLEKLKQLYDEELRMMRVEIEELSTVKNRYSLENFNLEIKLQDFIEKFEEIKRNNETLAGELNETKTKNNRLEYELETLKLEADHPVRENKQLRKDLEDLLNKLNEKQAISDNEIAYRQELEIKYKELLDSSKFEKKLFEQEQNKMKDQLEAATETIKHLETKFNESIQKEIERNDMMTKKLTEFQMENESTKYEKKQLEDQLESMRSLCSNFETVISDLEHMKRTVLDRVKREATSDEYDIIDHQLDENVMNTIKEIRRKIKAEEARLKLTPSRQQLHHQLVKRQNTIESTISDTIKQAQSDIELQVQEEIDKLLGSNTHRSANSYTPPIKQTTIDQLRQHSAIGPVLNRSQSATLKTSNNNNIMVRNLDHNKTPLRTSSQLDHNNENFFPSPPSTPEQQTIHHNSLQLQQPNKSPRQQQHQHQQHQPANNFIVPGKDHTADLFNNFEKTTFLNDNKPDEIIKSNLNTQQSYYQQPPAIIEASYTGNIKIHEVNKHGYYVRILNVSNTTDEDLSQFTIQQMVSGMPVAIFRFPKTVKLAPGNTITVWARTDEVNQQPPQTFVWNEQEKWGTGPECTTILAKPNGQAVSWTTGCHKYGNVDYDDIVTVYSHKRSKTASVQLNRKKLTPQTIFTPTKHPHASSTRLDSIESSSNDKQKPSNESNHSRNIFSASKTRYTNSASLSGHRRTGAITISEYDNSDDNNETNDFKQNFNYFSKTNRFREKEQTLFKNKIN